MSTHSCYKLLASTKVKRTILPVNYTVNPTNLQGLTESFVNSAFFNSAERWIGTDEYINHDNLRLMMFPALF